MRQQTQEYPRQQLAHHGSNGRERNLRQVLHTGPPVPQAQWVGAGHVLQELWDAGLYWVHCAPTPGLPWCRVCWRVCQWGEADCENVPRQICTGLRGEWVCVCVCAWALLLFRSVTSSVCVCVCVCDLSFRDCFWISGFVRYYLYPSLWQAKINFIPHTPPCTNSWES